MLNKKRFSKDPKVNLISIEEFYDNSDYLCDIEKKDLWKINTIPDVGNVLFKITSQYLICTLYGYSFTNFGMDIKEKLVRIDVAIRDGKTEYELFDAKLNALRDERSKHRRSKKLDEQISKIEKARKLLPKYKEKVQPKVKPFESYLSDTKYKTSKDELKNKYLVFDVETNGIRKSNDDLLSLSIYDPTAGMCYNRYFPLDLQPLILTGFIHGINDEMLTEATHMTQEEMNWLYDYFHLNDRILLSFSGGQGTFDSSFVQNYCRRQMVTGFDNLKYENIKSRIPQAPFGAEGQLTKDNLCRLFGIEGVSEVHSSYNDCILEWKLFEKLESECVFFINEHLFKYTPEYIIPCSYLNQNPDLVRYANIKVPNINGDAIELFKLGFPKKILNEIKKFPANITGVTIEHGINRYLNAEEQDNFLFLVQNKSHLQYVGSLDSNIEDIPIITQDDGTVKATKEDDKEYIEAINTVTKIIIEHIKPVADYLKENIFKEDKIMTQELVISDDRKVLALCDLSDSKNVVEIKTFDVLEDGNHISKKVARQLFFQANGRNAYVLSVKFDTHFNDKALEAIVDDLNIYLYKVELSEYNPSAMAREWILTDEQIIILRAIKEKQTITKNELANITGLSVESINRFLYILKTFGYIKRERRSPWIVLRDLDDVKTKYTIDEQTIHIIKE